MELQDLSAESVRQREKIEALKERVAAIEEEIHNASGFPQDKETLSREMGAKCKDCQEKVTPITCTNHGCHRPYVFA